MKKLTPLLFAVLAFSVFHSKAQTVVDIDGNIYNTVDIGSQTWMKENLMVTKFNDGTNITYPSYNDSLWEYNTTGAYSFWGHDTTIYKYTYGALYNWYTLDPIANGGKNVCPSGWHVSTEHDWNVLETFLDSTVDTTNTTSILYGTDVGGKLKDTVSLWNMVNVGATNSSGFSALPGGDRYSSGSVFSCLQSSCFFWSAQAYDSLNAWIRTLNFTNSQIQLGYYPKNVGASVRCVKNSTTGIGDILDKLNFRIYPNPSTDRVIIEYTDQENVKILVYNGLGECVIQSQLTNGVNNIDISFLSKGIYFLKLSSSKRTITGKLIKN